MIPRYTSNVRIPPLKPPSRTVHITGGTGGSTGTGGSITITAGNGAGTNGNGGPVSTAGTISGRVSTKAQTVWSDGKREISVGKKYLLNIPKDLQHLAPNWDGKKVTVVSINTQLRFNIEVQHPALQGDPVKNICACEPSWLQPLCSCTVITLLHNGCKCGGV